MSEKPDSAAKPAASSKNDETLARLQAIRAFVQESQLNRDKLAVATPQPETPVPESPLPEERNIPPERPPESEGLHPPATGNAHASEAPGPEAGKTVSSSTPPEQPQSCPEDAHGQTKTAPTAPTEDPATDAHVRKEPPSVKAPDPVALSQALVKLAERSQPIIREFLDRIKLQPPDIAPFDPVKIGNAWMNLTAQIMAHPERMVEAQLGLWQDYLRLWQSTTRKFLGEQTEPVIQPPPNDRRFNDVAWNENTLFDFIKQSYLLTARWVQSAVHDIEGLDPKTTRKIDFYTRQFVDAMSPSNFLITNPEVLRTTAESGGENLIKGLQNMLDDLERGQGMLKISMTDLKAFKLGENIATTPGTVVWQNDLMQLIMYAPMTEQVHHVPLLIIPPWINKYYILDLREKNSFVRYCLEQGHTVFMISWVNPDEKLAAKNFEDYMAEGPLDAIRRIKAMTGEDDVNVIGYCLGGTLLACAQAWLNAQTSYPADLPKIKSATYFVTMVDFRDAGEISVFIDDEQIKLLEAYMANQGYLDAQAMATTFNMLRANDLIWSFVVNNYLLGKEPFPFDLLYWNSDSTRMPAAMHSFYLRKMYQENRLVEAGGVTLKGVPIDLRTVTTPSFMLSTREDHITPWRSTYAATQIYGGPITFVLSGSGHIAGVINPPAAKKYGYWTNPDLPTNPDDWYNGATQHEGSWWPEWKKWIAAYAGEPVPARRPEDTGQAIEDAPGRYVRVRAI